MTPFTDEDLKKLKESMENYPDWYQERCGDMVPRILSRLEAAERCIESLCVDEADMAAWRKSKGSEG